MSVDISQITELKLSGECLQSLLNTASKEQTEFIEDKFHSLYAGIQEINTKLHMGAMGRYGAGDAVRDIDKLVKDLA